MIGKLHSHLLPAVVHISGYYSLNWLVLRVLLLILCTGLKVLAVDTLHYSGSQHQRGHFGLEVLLSSVLHTI